MSEYESEAAKLAQDIVDTKNSPFVTDDILRSWIRTAITHGYSAGRMAVYREEQEGILKQARENFSTTSPSMNRKERWAAEVTK